MGKNVILSVQRIKPEKLPREVIPLIREDRDGWYFPEEIYFIAFFVFYATLILDFSNYLSSFLLAISVRNQLIIIYDEDLWRKMQCL